MDTKISQDGSPESRPNLRSEDGTLFIYNRQGGIYEPYKTTEEVKYEKFATTGQSASGRFAKHWRKHWTFWVPASINFLTFLVIAFYTYYARQQVCVSMKAVDAANLSIKTTAKSQNLDARAWVSVYNVVPLSSGNMSSTSIIFENKGKTPAKNFSVLAGAGASVNSEERQIPGKGIIAPDGTFHSVVPSDSPTIKPTELYVHGKIAYLSVFGTEHWTRFCYQEFPKTANSAGGFAPCESGNDIDTNDP